MKQLYGASFVTVYGPTPSAIWLDKLAELTDDECREGLRRLTDKPSEYPANLTQFVEACRPRSAGVRYLGRPIDPATLALPVPRPSEEQRQAVLARLRRTVGASSEPRKNASFADDEPKLLEGSELHEERMRQIHGLANLAARLYGGERTEDAA